MPFLLQLIFFLNQIGLSLEPKIQRWVFFFLDSFWHLVRADWHPLLSYKLVEEVPEQRTTGKWVLSIFTRANSPASSCFITGGGQTPPISSSLLFHIQQGLGICFDCVSVWGLSNSYQSHTLWLLSALSSYVSWELDYCPTKFCKRYLCRFWGTGQGVSYFIMKAPKWKKTHIK